MVVMIILVPDALIDLLVTVLQGKEMMSGGVVEIAVVTALVIVGVIGIMTVVVIGLEIVEGTAMVIVVVTEGCQPVQCYTIGEKLRTVSVPVPSLDKTYIKVRPNTSSSPD